GFEVRLPEGLNRFYLAYGTVGNSGSGATVGVRKDSATFTQFSCNTASITTNLLLIFDEPSCPTLTPTGTQTGIPTLTPTNTPTYTPTSCTVYISGSLNNQYPTFNRPEEFAQGSQSCVPAGYSGSAVYYSVTELQISNPSTVLASFCFED